MRWLGAGTVTALTVTLVSACVAIPVPIVGHTGVYKAIAEEHVQFVHVGTTTLADVMTRLGRPTATEEPRRLVYWVEEYAGGAVWMWAIGTGYSGAGDVGVTYRKTTRQLTIDFDDNWTVTRYGFSEVRTESETKCFGSVFCR